MFLQKWLTIFGSSLYGGAILMVTTDYFLEDSLVLGWVWERVKVNQIWMKHCFRVFLASTLLRRKWVLS